ncbi:hypothetical protein WJX73_000876 [Symbiochloris irregularis]|uniref:BZIP domain-containing protein n=1 Tax=Symbiochloris irregularis TaxID=706552 RepID=A0AAW1NYL0_9CHLO
MVLCLATFGWTDSGQAQTCPASLPRICHIFSRRASASLAPASSEVIRLRDPGSDPRDCLTILWRRLNSRQVTFDTWSPPPPSLTYALRLPMLSATAATASGAPPAMPPSARKKRAISETCMDRGEDSSSNGAGQLNDQMLPHDETALQRAKKMQEKNKRAQARYRARQREKMEGLDDQVGKLANRVNELQAAADDLTNQRDSLQHALDQQLCGRCGGPNGGASAAPSQPGTCMAIVKSDEGRGSAYPASEIIQCTPARPPPVRAPYGKLLSACHPMADLKGNETGFDIFIPHILKVSAGRSLSTEQLQQPTLIARILTPPDWYLVYKSFVSDLAMHLMEADKDLNSSAHSEVEKLITSKRRLTSATHDSMGQHVTQEKLEAKNIIHIEPQRQFGAPPPCMWAKVAAAANFTRQQKELILNVRRKFLESLQEIIRQRRCIISELQESVPDFKSSGANSHATITKAFQASHHLCESIVQEHAMVWAFLKEVCHENMSPIQEARVMVASFPFFPDTPAICNAIAHESHSASFDVQSTSTERPSAASTGSHMQTSTKADGAMSTIFNSLRNEGPSGQQQQCCGHQHTCGASEGLATQGVAPGNGASSSTGSALGEPKLSDTSFGLGDMWAAQQPLLLDSAWVAALPDLPLQQLGPAWGIGQDTMA